MSPLPEVLLGNNEPLYNIGVVARMTGVSMATLRAWERRYQFPDSERTAGGHRLYSERDVMRLRWVKERIDEGMQTAQAISALRHQERNGNLTLVEPVAAPREEKLPQNATYLHTVEDPLYHSLIQRDLVSSDAILGEALAVSSPEELILNVIGPTFTRVGKAWEDGEISVATEHLATNYLRQRLLMWMVGGPPPRATSPIILACGPNEWHEGSLLIMGALLRRRRWPVAYLGQAVPLPDLAGFTRDIKPSLVILIAMTENTATQLAEWPRWLPEAAQSGRPLIAYGGRIFTLQPQWRSRMPGIYLGDNFRDGLTAVEKMLPHETS